MGAECPDGRPGAFDGRDAGANFHLSVEEGIGMAGVEGGGGVFCVGADASPVFSPGIVAWIGDAVEPSLKNEEAVLGIGVLGLVPLVFLVAYEACFRLPFLRVESAGSFKFVVPYELPGGIAGGLGKGCE